MYIFGKFSYFLEKQETYYCFSIFHKSWVLCYDVYHQWDSFLVTLVTCWYGCFSFLSHSNVLWQQEYYLDCSQLGLFIKRPSILRLIVTSLIITFNITLLLYLLFLLPYKLQICLPSHARFLILNCWLANSQGFLQLHHEFVNGC